MVLKYFYYLYYKITGYLYHDNNNYNLPFEIEEIEKEENFQNYKNNNEINKTIFALNNMPEIIHTLLFNNINNISNNYYYIRIRDQQVDHNLVLYEDMIDQNIQYIFIRLNIINNNSMNHVNGIIINKSQKYVLIYEPQVELSFDKLFMEEFLKLKSDFSNYKFIYAEDIGYNVYNKMQNYDLFCQTYVLLVFILIIMNDNINYKKYRKMFNTLINYKNLGYFLYFINTLLQENNYDICCTEDLWAYPTNRLQNISNWVHFFFNNNRKEDQIDVDIIEHNDMYIIEKDYINGSFNNGILNELTLPPSDIETVGISVENVSLMAGDVLCSDFLNISTSGFGASVPLDEESPIETTSKLSLSLSI